MTAGGWITMTLSLALVWGGSFWCFWKVLTVPPEGQATDGSGA
jgi:hypothetical protein